MNSASQSKDEKVINFLLGAGFSHAMVGLPLVSEINSSVFDKTQDKLKVLQNTLGDKVFISKHGYEYLHEMIRNAYNSSELFLKNNSTIIEEEKYQDYIDDLKAFDNVIKEVLLEKLDLSKCASLPNENTQNFIKLLDKLLEEKYTINLFDLNHDALLETILDERQDYIPIFRKEQSIKHVNKKHEVISQLFIVRSPNHIFSSTKRENQINHFKLHGSIKFTYPDFKESELKEIFSNIANNKERNKESQAAIIMDIINPGLFYSNSQNQEYLRNNLDYNLITGHNKISSILNNNYTKACFEYLKEVSDNATIIIGYSGDDMHLDHYLKGANELVKKTQESKAAKIAFKTNMIFTSLLGNETKEECELLQKLKDDLKDENNRQKNFEDYLKEIIQLKIKCPKKKLLPS